MRIDNPQVQGQLELREGSTSELSGSFSGSFQGDGSQLTGIQTYTQSEISGAFDEVSSSLSTRTTDLETFSSSLDTTFATDTELQQVSSSLANRITSQETFSSSLDTTFATDTELQQVSSSLVSDISLNDGRLFTLEGKTLISSSVQLDNSSISNLTLSGSTNISGSLVSNGTITANSFSGDGSGLTGVVGGLAGTAVHWSIRLGEGAVQTIYIDENVHIRISDNDRRCEVRDLNGNYGYQRTGGNFLNIDIYGFTGINSAGQFQFGNIFYAQDNTGITGKKFYAVKAYTTLGGNNHTGVLYVGADPDIQ